MDSQHEFDTISATSFDTLLSQYPGHTLEPKVADLEQQRLETIPNLMKQRDPVFISKEELVILMDWKLYHGTFRVTLQKLILQNPTMTVKTNAIECYRLMQAQQKASSTPPTEVDVKRWLEIFSRLKGVGPATASLLLNLFDPQNIAFFSDELYRWAFWSAPTVSKLDHDQIDQRPSHSTKPTKAANAGWTKEIKYTVKDYLELYPEVHKLKSRLEAESGKAISCLDIEQVAYVLGRKGQAGAGRKSSRVARTSGSRKRKADVGDGSIGPTEVPDPAPKKPKSDGKNFGLAGSEGVVAAVSEASKEGATGTPTGKKRRGSKKSAVPADTGKDIANVPDTTSLPASNPAL